MKFKVGDIVEGLSDHYEITNKGSKCRVEQIGNSGLLWVETLESSSSEFEFCKNEGYSVSFWVDPDYFRLCGELLFTDGVK